MENIPRVEFFSGDLSVGENCFGFFFVKRLEFSEWGLAGFGSIRIPRSITLYEKLYLP